MKLKIPLKQRLRRAFTLVSFLLFPVTIYYFSPYLIVMGAGEGIINGSLIVFAGMFLLSLFFGRAFCGWICPMGGLADVAIKVNGKPFKAKWPNLIKWFLWIPWLGLIVAFFIRAGGVKSVYFLYQIETGISVSNVYGYIIYYAVIVLVLVLSFATRKRGFCHTTCWIAPFMILGRKARNIFRWPALHLKVRAYKCIECGTCNDACPMSLNVMTMVKKGYMENDECILCGECTSVCPQEVIRFGIFGQKVGEGMKAPER